MKSLKQFVAPRGKPIRGAIAAVARHLRVAHNTVKRWVSGEWVPGRSRKAEIRAMIEQGIALEPLRKSAVVSGSGVVGSDGVGRK